MDTQLQSVYVLNDKVLFASQYNLKAEEGEVEEAEQKVEGEFIAATNFEKFLVDNLGIQECIVKSALQLQLGKPQQIEFPAYLVKEMMMKQYNR